VESGREAVISMVPAIGSEVLPDSVATFWPNQPVAAVESAAVATGDVSVTWRKVDDAARDSGVLVGVVAGADPVVAVGDLRDPVGSDVATHEKDRGEFFGHS
jgi:hypothetical protein